MPEPFKFNSYAMQGYKEVDLKSPVKLDIPAIAEKIPDAKYKNFEEEKEQLILVPDGTGYHAVLMRFNTDKGSITKIGSPYSTARLADALETAMPKEDFLKLKELLKGTKLDLTISQQEKEHFIIDKKEFKKNNSLINEVAKLPRKRAPFTITPDTARSVLQGEYGIVKAEHKQHIIGSYGAGPCIIIGAYNPETKAVALAHMDSLSTLNSLKGMLEQVKKGAKDTKIELHLAGGDISSKEMACDIIRIIKEDKQLEIKTANILPLGEDPASLAIDAKTGKVMENIFHTSLDAGRDADIRLKIVGLKFEKTPLIKPPESIYRHPVPADKNIPKKEPVKEKALSKDMKAAIDTIKFPEYLTLYQQDDTPSRPKDGAPHNSKGGGKNIV